MSIRFDMSAKVMCRGFSASIYLAILAAALIYFENHSVGNAQQLKCDTGPVTKTFGSAPWLVYSCQDGRSLAIVSAPGSPAMPFYFFAHPAQDGYRIEGEGTGNKDTTDRALAELQRLSAAEITSLIAETRKSIPANSQ